MIKAKRPTNVAAINDAHTRACYIADIQRASSTAKADLATGRINSLEAAEHCYAMRNQLMAKYRNLTSVTGLATAKQIKSAPPSIADLFEQYARRLFSCSYQNLSTEQQQGVHYAVIDASGRSNPTL